MSKRVPLPVTLVSWLFLLQGTLNGALGVLFLIELLSGRDVAPGDPEGLIGLVVVSLFLAFCALLLLVGWNLRLGKRAALLGAIVASSLEGGFYALAALSGWVAHEIGFPAEWTLAALAGAGLHAAILVYLIFSPRVRDAFGR
ncbi:MAG: hypothetical protein AB7N76_29635 [Planctomycetota bacterium]